MRKLTSMILLAGAVALGLAACDDDEGVGPEPAVLSVSVTPQNLTLTEGESAQLSAQVEAEGGAETSVEWSSANAEVATIDQQGVVTAQSAGNTTVTATSTVNPNKAASAAVTVEAQAPPVASISVTPSSFAIEVGETIDLDADVQTNREGVSEEVTWESSSTEVATVASDGTVEGTGLGEVTITATSQADPSMSAEATGEVNDSSSVSSIEVTPDDATVNQGENATFKAEVVADSGVTDNVTWSVGDTSVAQMVSQDDEEDTGTFEGVGSGSTTITATAVADEDRSATANLTVSSFEEASVSIENIVKPADDEDEEQQVDTDDISGRIVVKVNIIEGEETVTKFELLVDDEVVDEQTFSSSSDRTVSIDSEVEHEIRTAKIDRDEPGNVHWRNGDYDITARIFTEQVGEDSASATATRGVVFDNMNDFVGELVADGEKTAMDEWGFTWEKGSLTAKALPLLYDPVDFKFVEFNVFKNHDTDYPENAVCKEFGPVTDQGRFEKSGLLPVKRDSSANDEGYYTVTWSDEGDAASFELNVVDGSARNRQISKHAMKFGVRSITAAGEMGPFSKDCLGNIRLDNKKPAGNLALKPPFSTVGPFSFSKVRQCQAPNDPSLECDDLDRKGSIPPFNWINEDYVFGWGVWDVFDFGVGGATHKVFTGPASGDTVPLDEPHGIEDTDDVNITAELFTSDKLMNSGRMSPVTFGVDSDDPELVVERDPSMDESPTTGLPFQHHRINASTGRATGFGLGSTFSGINHGDPANGMDFDPRYTLGADLPIINFKWTGKLGPPADGVAADDNEDPGLNDLDDWASTDPAPVEADEWFFGRLVRLDMGGLHCMVGMAGTGSCTNPVPFGPSLDDGLDSSGPDNGYYFFTVTAQDKAGNQTTELEEPKFDQDESLKIAIIIDDVPAEFSGSTSWPSELDGGNPLGWGTLQDVRDASSAEPDLQVGDEGRGEPGPPTFTDLTPRITQGVDENLDMWYWQDELVWEQTEYGSKRATPHTRTAITVAGATDVTGDNFLTRNFSTSFDDEFPGADSNVGESAVFTFLHETGPRSWDTGGGSGRDRPTDGQNSGNFQDSNDRFNVCPEPPTPGEPDPADFPFDDNSEEDLNKDCEENRGIRATVPFFPASVEEVNDSHMPIAAPPIDDDDSNGFLGITWDIADAANNNSVPMFAPEGLTELDGAEDYELTDVLIWEMTDPQVENSINVQDRPELGDEFNQTITVAAEATVADPSDGNPFDRVEIYMVPTAPTEAGVEGGATDVSGTISGDMSRFTPRLLLIGTVEAQDAIVRDRNRLSDAVDARGGGSDTDERVYRYRFRWDPTIEQARFAVRQMPWTALKTDAQVKLVAVGYKDDGAALMTHALEFSETGTVCNDPSRPFANGITSWGSSFHDCADPVLQTLKPDPSFDMQTFPSVAGF